MNQEQNDLNEMSKQEIEHSAEQYTNYRRRVLSEEVYSGRATAETFENYIAKEGLDMWAIALISEYYENDISYEDRKEVRKIVHSRECAIKQKGIPQKIVDSIVDYLRIEKGHISSESNFDCVLVFDSIKVTNTDIGKIISVIENYDWKLADWLFVEKELTLWISKEVEE